MEGNREEPPASDIPTAMKKDGISLAMILRGTAYLVSLNLLVFLRRQFGERMVCDLCVAFGCSWFCSKIYTVLRIRFFPNMPEPRLAPFFLHALAGLTAWHLVCIWWRTNRSAIVHSFSRGRPMRLWLVLRVSEPTIERYVQPCACALLACGLWPWDRALACWIGAASVAVFVEEQLARIRARTRVLDTIDGRIESQSLYGLVQEKVAPVLGRAARASVVGIAEPSKSTAGNLEGIMARLDPELQKMLEPTGTLKPEKQE